MNKRLLSKLEQGEGTTLMGKLFLTPRQRQTVLKWFLFSLVYLALQVLQDVVFSRVQVLGGSGGCRRRTDLRRCPRSRRRRLQSLRSLRQTRRWG